MSGFSPTRTNLSLGLPHLLAPVLAVGSAVAAWRSRGRWASANGMRSVTPDGSAGEEDAD
jgi:hypothetical protein